MEPHRLRTLMGLTVADTAMLGDESGRHSISINRNPWDYEAVAAARKLDLDQRLAAYFSTLSLKRGTRNWQIYAAVTGSAMAMVTGASAAIIGSGMRDTAAQPEAGITTAKRQFASSQSMPMLNAVRQAMARQNSAVQTGQANPGQAAPSIPGGGVVPVYGSASTIQPGEWITIYGSNLASGTVMWNGDFPLTLGGTSVTINGKAAYLMFVSPGRSTCRRPTTRRPAR